MSKNSAKALYEQIKIFNNYIQYNSKRKKKIKQEIPSYLKIKNN